MRQLSQIEDNHYTVRLYDVITNDDLSYMFVVMEFMQMDLAKVLENRNIVEMKDAIVMNLTFKLLCALNFIHSANIVHRDLKPSNILIDNQCNLKLCDFGLARSMPKKELEYKERSKADITQKLIKSTDKR